MHGNGFNSIILGRICSFVEEAPLFGVERSAVKVLVLALCFQTLEGALKSKSKGSISKVGLRVFNMYFMSKISCPMYSIYYCMSEKSLPILYIKFLYKMG